VREDPRDILVCKTDDTNFLNNHFHATIATGSVRRKAQWLSKFPNHTLVDLRGNVDTRLQKLKDNNWQGAIFAYAGLKRLNIQPEHFYFPDWMMPAAAQGVVAVVCKKDDVDTAEKIAAINHEPTAITTTVERDFLRLMDGGCVAPIGALAVITGDKINFDIAVYSTNGTEKVQLHFEASLQHYNVLGAQAYKDAAAQGALAIIQHLK